MSFSDDDTLAAPTRPGKPSSERVVVRSADYRELVPVDPAHYQRGEEIAKGGMGRIFAGRDLRLGRPVAIKELLVSSGELRARFEREARITARLQHPSIVNVIEAGTWPGGEPFYAMKLVTGQSLDKVIAATQTLADRLALLPNAIAVCDALAYAHDNRVIHRDLKPANVLVGAFGETVVIDWGLAKDLNDASDIIDPVAPESEGETIAGSIIGTPAYMPPEQARGDAVDERADVYALGAMLYHTLSGQPPYRAKNTAALVQMVIDKPPPSLATVTGIPADLATVVDKAMARDPKDRYANASGLAEELKRFQTGQLVGAHHYSLWALVRRWLYRHRGVVSISVVAVVALTILSVVGVKKIMHERDRAETQMVEAKSARDQVRDRLSRLYEEQGRQALAVGNVEPAAVFLSEALTLADRPSLRFLLGRALPPLDAKLSREIVAKGPIVKLAVHGDLALATVADDKNDRLPKHMQLWNLATGAEIEIKRWDDAVVVDVEWSPDGETFFVTSTEHFDQSPVTSFGFVSLYEATGKMLGSISQQSAAGDAEFIRGGKAVAIATSNVSIVPVPELAGGSLVKGERAYVHGDLALVKTEKETRIVQLADPPPKKPSWEVQTFPADFDFTDAPIWSPDGKKVLLDDVVWYTTSVSFMAKVPVNTATDRTVAAFAPNSDMLAATDRDRTITLWNLGTSRAMATLVGHTGEIRELVYNTDGTRLLSIADDGTARVWDSVGELVALLHAGDNARRARFAGDRVITVAGKQLRVWDVPAVHGPIDVDPAKLADFTPPPDVTQPVHSPDRSRIATTDLVEHVRISHAASGVLVSTLDVPRTKITSVSFSPDGTLLAATAEDRTARIWDVQTGSLLATLRMDNPIERALWSRDGHRIATQALGGQTRIWELPVEARSPKEVAAFVRCKIPLTLVMGKVLPSPVDCPR